MFLKRTLAVLLSATMLFGMTSLSTTAATTDTEAVSAGNYYNASYLENYASNAYNEQNLGANYSKSSTEFKVWSPEASAVKVKLYATGSDSESGAAVLGTYNLKKNSSTGMWSVTVNGDFKNTYYTYLVTVNGTTNETQDVYSKATGVNGNRSMVVDLDSTDPDGWDNDNHVLFNNAQEAVVWEVHVRDFSISDTSGVSDDNKGKYLAFTEGGTKISSDTSANAVSTCADYLVKSGINCVQLMPVYDFGSVDETITGSATNRNWGYDPVNYNVPEGSYSSNPYDGNVRITEFKQMIQALHDRGISVVMDVVYNHTYVTEGSCFTDTVPNYYYRKTSSSVYSNGSGCGNETASDKLMYRKYMIDSILYWASEYHIDGFRFDLMGLHDIATMNQIRSSLDNLYSDGSGKKILMYGEPWTGGSSAISDGCFQSKASQLDARVGMFCDSYRDAIKGGTNDASTGFIQGNNGKTYTVVNGVKGQCFGAKAPSQTIAYADAHDNLIMWDKMVLSNGSKDWNSTSSSLTDQMKATMGLLMTSQGIVFMTAGSEFCRTKQGDHNSYKSADSINAIDWTRLKTYSETADYYKGLLKIRENYSPLKGGNFSTPTFQSSYGYVVAYTYSNNTAGEWGKVCVLVNSGTQACTIDLDGSGWTVVANGTKAGLESLGTVSGKSYSIPARSTCVLVQSSTFGNLQNAEPTYGTLKVNHIDENGNVLKSTSATYKTGTTYRALPDTTLLYDYNLVNTTGTTTGKVESGKTYTVTFTYKSSGISSGYLTVNYVNANGTKVKDSVKNKMRSGDEYSVSPATIQGYQLDTDSFPANTSGTFSGTDTTITFKYKNLNSTSTVVHYKKPSSWSDVRCYSYTDDGKNPTGEWNTATVMTSEGDGWYKCTVPASACYVMFHPTSNTAQEPGQGASGYPASGEVWINNGAITFTCTVITSHIDIATGKKIAADVVSEKTKVTSSDTYTTSAVAGKNVITPVNATGNYTAGVINVVYLYDSGEVPTTAPTTQPTTAQPSTSATEIPSTPSDKVLIGDVDTDGNISINDVSVIQLFISEQSTLTDKQLIAADTNDDGSVDVIDATFVQMYLVDNIADGSLVGQYKYIDVPPVTIATTVAPTTQPTTAKPTTQPTTAEPTTEPTTPSGTYTVTFANSLNWDGTIYCYYWTSGSQGEVAWPGTKMNFVENNDYGQAVYTLTVPTSCDSVIFTNGSSQTVDINTGSKDTNYYAKTTKTGTGYNVGTW